ncbi:diphthamide synthesis protein [Candidatus Woesearchaeota archaeon]|nr:diphthamide synthesis protein [Candidatus Woesearchaeota archaeon]
MQRLFIETKYEGKLTIPRSLIKPLPSKIVLALPVQFYDFISSIQQQLETAGKKVTLFKGVHGKYPGQVLGCDVFKFSGDYDAFLYIGDGKFHPTALLYENKKSVFCFNPFTSKLEILTPEYLQKVLQRRTGQLSKFLSADTVGILITTKLGQNQSKKAEELREKLERAGKKVFVFIAEEINLTQLENFNFIDVWVNTACPRIVEDFKCLNVGDLKEIGL